MTLLAHWFAGVSGIQLQPGNQYPLSIAFCHNCAVELVTNVASLSLILIFPHMWKSQIARNGIVYLWHI